MYYIFGFAFVFKTTSNLNFIERSLEETNFLFTKND